MDNTDTHVRMLSNDFSSVFIKLNKIKIKSLYCVKKHCRATDCASLSNLSQISGASQLKEDNPDSFSDATKGGVEHGGKTS